MRKIRLAPSNDEGNTIPAFPNWYPYNDLLIDGKLIAKSRSWEWKHRGLTLLYTGTRVASEVAAAHGVDPRGRGRKVLVGVGNLVDVRPFTRSERALLRRQFINATPQKMRSIKRNYEAYVEPAYFGYFFTDLQRFETPVPFEWPSGPVLPIHVPTTLVEAAFRQIGLES